MKQNIFCCGFNRFNLKLILKVNQSSNVPHFNDLS